MAEKLVQHRHCQMCLKAIPLSEEYCNDECKEKWDQLIKANKKTDARINVIKHMLKSIPYDKNREI